jgi:hypothetical protein
MRKFVMPQQQFTLCCRKLDLMVTLDQLLNCVFIRGGKTKDTNVTTHREDRQVGVPKRSMKDDSVVQLHSKLIQIHSSFATTGAFEETLGTEQSDRGKRYVIPWYFNGNRPARRI